MVHQERYGVCAWNAVHTCTPPLFPSFFLNNVLNINCSSAILQLAHCTRLLLPDFQSSSIVNHIILHYITSFASKEAYIEYPR